MFKMGVQISKKGIETMNSYKYKTNPPTPLDAYFEPFWNGTTQRLPKVSF